MSLSEEQRNRVQKALSETMLLLERAESYAPQYQDRALIVFYEKHIETLKNRLDSTSKRFMVSVIKTIYVDYEVIATNQADAKRKVIAGEEVEISGYHAMTKELVISDVEQIQED